MIRSILLGAAAFTTAAAIPSTPAQAQDDDIIVIEGPREHRGAGLHERVLTASTLVYYDDLRLDTEYGRDVLKARVRDAAEETCDMLDDYYAGRPSLNAQFQCVRKAVRGASAQVDAAIARDYYG